MSTKYNRRSALARAVQAVCCRKFLSRPQRRGLGETMTVEVLERRLLLAFDPYQIRNAYGLNDPIITEGNQGRTGLLGAGQTIAIVVAFNDPQILQHVNEFNDAYGLYDFNGGTGTPTLTVYDQNGRTGLEANLPATDPTWLSEEDADVEWAHVSAPMANIDVVEANSDRVVFHDLPVAIASASKLSGVSVVSISIGNKGALDDSLFETPGITYVASSGDNGSYPLSVSPAENAFDALNPAASPYVLAVGGTDLGPSAALSSQVAWPQSGGGYGAVTVNSNEFYQDALRMSSSGAVQTGPAQKSNYNLIETNRAVPDVAWQAGFVWEYDSMTDPEKSPYEGTSVAAPMWAGLIADIDARLAQSDLGMSPLSGYAPGGHIPANDQALPLLYTIAQKYPGAFNDVTQGTGAGYPLNSSANYPLGFDLVTGLGSPNPQKLVDDIAAYEKSFIHVDASATGTDTGLTWADAYPTLQQGLAAAVPGDTIEVAPGTYYTTQDATDPTATFQLEDGVTLEATGGPNNSTLPAILSGDGISYHVVTASGTDKTAVIDGFTITGGGNADVLGRIGFGRIPCAMAA